MGCEWVKVGDTWAIVRFGGKRKNFCEFCHERAASKLCDATLHNGETCDAAMCDVCATKGGKDIDYCPDHKYEAKQGGLFA